MMGSLLSGSVQVCFLVYCTCLELFLFAPTSGGGRLCTCGGDGIVRVVDPTAKVEVISKRAPEILQLVCCCIG